MNLCVISYTINIVTVICHFNSYNIIINVNFLFVKLVFQWNTFQEIGYDKENNTCQHNNYYFPQYNIIYYILKIYHILWKIQQLHSYTKLKL